MSSMTLFILFVCVIAVLFLAINLIFAPHNPYQEKYSIFECGFHSFLGQNRTQFGVKFFIFALVYLLLDLEILLTFPFAVSGYVNNIYGLMVTLGFIGIITIGFVYELGKSALKIDSRQTISKIRLNSSYKSEFISKAIDNNFNSKSKQIYLESNIIPLSFFKGISKHFTFKNFLIGFSTVFIVSLLKWLGVPQYIMSNILFLLPEGILAFTEYFIYGTLALVIRLGLKGLIEEILKEPLPSSLPLHMAMDNNSSNDELPTEGREIGGAGQSDTSAGDIEEGNTNLAGNTGDSTDNLDKKDINEEAAKDISEKAEKTISDDILDDLTNSFQKLHTKAAEDFGKEKSYVEKEKRKEALTEEEIAQKKEDELLDRELEEAEELRRMFDIYKAKRARYKSSLEETVLGESSETTKRKASDNIENEDEKTKQTRLESNKDEKSE